ncbi:MAG TPA: Gldg family protein [Planctomycetota bacterium]|nr:Gldg family protein [Planctomycetota bacterium]
MSKEGDLQWGRRKRVLSWVHFSIQLAVLAAVLLMANLLARKFPARIDLTSSRAFAISSVAEDMLKNLKYDVTIWVNGETYSTSGDKALPAAVQRTLLVLEEFQRRTDHIKVYGLRDQNTPGFETFHKHWSAVPPATLFLLANLGGNRETQREIDMSELYEGDATTGELHVYKGEPILVHMIQDLGGGSKRIVYETDSHRETLTADVRHMSMLTNFLKINEGVEFRRLPLSDYKVIPVDCDLLMIIAPEQPFQEHELETIRDYLERGGSLLVAIRPKVKTNLEGLLEDYGVRVGNNIVCDPQQYTPPYITTLRLVDFNGAHSVNRGMANVFFEMPSSCTVDPVAKRDGTFTITPLAMAGPGSWEEKGSVNVGDNPKPDGDERVGSMKVITVAEKRVTRKDGNRKTAKLDVWGSSLPFTNAELRTPYVFQTTQGQYVVNHFRWLMERELLDIEPKKVVVKPLEMSGEALDHLKWVVCFGFPGFGVCLGVLAWFLRRK